MAHHVGVFVPSTYMTSSDEKKLKLIAIQADGDMMYGNEGVDSKVDDVTRNHLKNWLTGKG